MNTPVQELLTQCGWLSIRQLIVYHDLLQVYKTKKTQRPGYLVKKFSRKFGAGNRYPTSLSESDAIRVDSRIRTDLGKSNFSYVAANLWNRLPVALSHPGWIQIQHKTLDQSQHWYMILKFFILAPLNWVVWMNEWMSEWMKSFHLNKSIITCNVLWKKINTTTTTT